MFHFELVQFYIVEDAVYKADVAIKTKVQDSQGTTLWEGMARGESNRWGRSFRKKNFTEAMSNAVVDAIYYLLQDKELYMSLSADLPVD